jgi:hypothetical protein
MTVEEKIEMYSEKKVFIGTLDTVFKMKPAGSSVEGISYEVYKKEIDDTPVFREWLVIHFDGGAIIPVQVTGNSNLANFRVIATYLIGGYYDEVQMYKRLPELGWELLPL